MLVPLKAASASAIKRSKQPNAFDTFDIFETFAIFVLEISIFMLLLVDKVEVRRLPSVAPWLNYQRIGSAYEPTSALDFRATLATDRFQHADETSRQGSR